MAISGKSENNNNSSSSSSNNNSRANKWGLCRMPFFNNHGGSSNNGTASWNNSSNSLTQHHHNNHGFNSSHGLGQQQQHQQQRQSSNSVTAVAKSLLPHRRRLKLDPATKLYFPYEPGKQARSAVRIKNISKSHVAFKFQTTAPKSCFMRPPGAVLAPGESVIATVFKFVEHPEENEKQDQKSKVKFKIMSLKVKGSTDYVPELFEEQKDHVAVEQVLRVIFLEPTVQSPQLDKLNRLLAEADAAVEARKKPPEDTGPRIVGEGLVIDEWKERRERYLARQQVDAVVNSV